MVEELTKSAFIWFNYKVDVSIRIGSGDFCYAAASVCVLDFVLTLHAARITLRKGRLAKFELSVRQDEWHFMRDKELIKLSTRYATRRAGASDPQKGIVWQVRSITS